MAALNHRKVDRIFVVAALGILLAAAFLRLYALATYPPGPHYDEAVNILIGRSILNGARFFPIVEAYQGREVLYMYLIAPALSWFGDEIFSLRIVNALCGLITTAAVIGLGRAMFGGQRGWIIGLAAGTMIAFSFPQMWLGRQAFRAVTLPLMQTLALFALFRGLRAGSRGYGWLIASGGVAGGALYTYMASRLFPFWLGIGGLALLWVDRAQWRLRLRQGAAFFIPLILVALPIALYALQKPDIFWGRLAEVTQERQSVSLGESIALHLRMFFLSGDTYFRYNIPQRPYLTLPEGGLMIVGLGVCALRLFRQGAPAVERAACGLALLSPLMIIPSVVSTGGLPPSHMRSVGMIPLLFILCAVAFEWLMARLRLSRQLTLGVMIGALILGSVRVAGEYFRWASSAEVFYETDADLTAAADWVIAHQSDSEIAGARLYIAARDRGHPTVMVRPVPPVTWLGTDSLFRAPEGETGLYIFPRSAPPPADWLAWLERGRLGDLPIAPDGRTAFEAFLVSGDTPLPAPDQLPPADVHNPYLRFLGLHAPPLPAGSAGEIVLDWRIEAPIPYADLTPLVQIEDASGHVLARSEAYVTETDRWEPGAVLMQRMRVHAPHETPPGRYLVRGAWVARSTETYVNYLRETGQGGIWATLGVIEMMRPAVPPLPDDIPTAIRMLIDTGHGITLLGYDPPPERLRPGEDAPFTVYWQAGDRPESFFVETVLRSADGEIALRRAAPLEDVYPIRRWTTGEIFAEWTRVTLPRDLAAGLYALVLRWQGGEVIVGEIAVEGAPRRYDPPAFDQPVDAAFGGVIRLAGYSLDIGEEIRLTLIWQSLTATETDYTVFVHLVDEQGAILAQQDAMPLQNGYPTSLWMPGEYVVDPYTFAQPAGKFTLRVGLYTQSDGVRLPVDRAGAAAGDFVSIAP